MSDVCGHGICRRCGTCEKCDYVVNRGLPPYPRGDFAIIGYLYRHAPVTMWTVTVAVSAVLIWILI